jgi:release factor glutamine methyltransferase
MTAAGRSTLHAHVARARERLIDAGIPPDEADLDARLLAEFVLGWTTERFFVDAGSEAPSDFESRYASLMSRRAAREPFAYIVGHQEFWGLEFTVTADVLIPRPETELIVEAVLGLVEKNAAARIADVGAGSGCLAIAIACERPAAALVATDTSDAALHVAQHNAARHGVADRVHLRRADLLNGVDERFDLIVSNPPYVRERDRAALQAEVRFEPSGALFAGDDGLDVIRRLVQNAPRWLNAGGTLIFEFGFGQADAVGQLISSTAGLRMIALRRDLQDIPRIAIARCA